MQTKESYKADEATLRTKIAKGKEHLRAAQREFDRVKKATNKAAAQVQTNIFGASQNSLFAPSAEGYSAALKKAADQVNSAQNYIIQLDQEIENLPLPNQINLFLARI